MIIIRMIHILFTTFIHTRRSVCSVSSHLKVNMATSPPPHFFIGPRNDLERPWPSVALSEVYLLVTNVRLSLVSF
jgi:hypothetical protein